jgi:hypothetical protein
VNLEIIELLDVKVDSFTTGCRFAKLRVRNFLALYLKEIRHNKIYVLLHDLKITSRHKECIFMF